MNTKISNTDQHLADVLPDAIIALNPRGEILWWNRAATILFELKDHQDTYIGDLLTQSEFKEFLTRKTHKPIEIQLLNEHKTIVSCSLVNYDEEQQLLIAKDVTRIRRLEMMRRDFVANVSHELRTPLTVVHGYLENLIEQDKAEKNPLTSIYNQMYQQTVRMGKLIKDLLLLSRLEIKLPDEDSLPKVKVGLMLQEICKDAKSLSGSNNHNIQLNVDPTLGLYGQEDELRSAFSNIIFNAVKYTPPNGNIYVEWFKGAEGALLRVHDSGIGIAPEHIPRLTERFYRVDKARSRSSGGTGLGLAIVKHVLKRHRARLYIDSESDAGSTFSCKFRADRHFILEVEAEKM